MKKPIVFVFILVFLLSCTTTARIDTFFLDQSIQQYFVRSTALNHGTFQTDMDFTVRTEKNQITNVVVNFSIKNVKEAISELGQAVFVFDDGETGQLAGFTLLYTDRINLLSRYSSTITPEKFKLLIRQKNPLFRVVLESKTYDFKPTAQFIAQMRGAETQFMY